jgi:hypothetical protein
MRKGTQVPLVLGPEHQHFTLPAIITNHELPYLNFMRARAYLKIVPVWLNTVYKRSRNLIINLYVLRHAHLFPYTAIFLLILCVGYTYQPYKSVFSIHRALSIKEVGFELGSQFWSRVFIFPPTSLNFPTSPSKNFKSGVQNLAVNLKK